MTREEFELLFRMECRQHGIPAVMRWDRRLKRSWGRYSPYNKVISFSEQMLNLDYATVMWIIRHELAHFLDYQNLTPNEWHMDQKSAHGESWKRYCKQLGCPATQFVC